MFVRHVRQRVPVEDVRAHHGCGLSKRQRVPNNGRRGESGKKFSAVHVSFPFRAELGSNAKPEPSAIGPSSSPQSLITNCDDTRKPAVARKQQGLAFREPLSSRKGLTGIFLTLRRLHRLLPARGRRVHVRIQKVVRSSTSCLVPTIGGMKWWYGESGLYSCSMVIKLSMLARSRPVSNLTSGR